MYSCLKLKFAQSIQTIYINLTFDPGKTKGKLSDYGGYGTMLLYDRHLIITFMVKNHKNEHFAINKNTKVYTNKPQMT